MENVLSTRRSPRRNTVISNVPLLLAVLVWLFSCGCGKKQTTMKESRWPDGTLQEQWYEDTSGVKHGKAETYHKNGQMSTQAEFKNGYLHGPFKMWDKEGNVLCDGTYKNGEPWSGTHVGVDEVNQAVVFHKYEDGKRVP